MDLKTLRELLLAPPRRDAVVADCVTRLETHVARRPGLKGIGLRTALAAVKAIRPDVVPKVVTRLLPDYLDALEPLHRRFRAGRERDFSRFLHEHLDEAAGAVLAVTDGRARDVRQVSLKTAYGRMRRLIEPELREFLPELGTALSTYLMKE